MSFLWDPEIHLDHNDSLSDCIDDIEQVLLLGHID